MAEFDFSGWATRNNLKCSDGRIIRQDAFCDQNGEEVPLVWNHEHSDPENVLGHALLENREEGVYMYGRFNNNAKARAAKEAVKNRDINAISIWANNLVQKGGDVLHGAIREVSLVLAGANPGALIDSIMIHGEESDDQAIIYTGMDIEINDVEHADKSTKKEDEAKIQNEEKTEEKKVDKKKEEKEAADSDNETVQDIIDSMNEKQKNVLEGLLMIASKPEEAKAAAKKVEEGDSKMAHNVFDTDEKAKEKVLSHSELRDIVDEAKRTKASLKETFLAHADGEEDSITYGFRNVDYLYPDAKAVTNEPTLIRRPADWVADFMGSISHSPFSRIKSIHADITADEARAKGYFKGNPKTEEVITLLKRKTDPTTVYKKQKLDRDDILDITDFNVVAFTKSEMRVMLDEELARAMLVGDGRSNASDDKIDPLKIRPIWTDDDLYTIKAGINVTAATTDEQKARAFIKACIKARKNYRGSGEPTLYTTEDLLTEMLMLTDSTGRDLYESEEKLRIKLRVKKIKTVPVMENLTRTSSTGDTHALMGIIINPRDYKSGADKGGAINMFDDFDIDYNQEKYLMETRCSGALTVPYSAIAIEAITAAPEPEDDDDDEGAQG